jgi:protein phosphatase 1 regulatory subunit 7
VRVTTSAIITLSVTSAGKLVSAAVVPKRVTDPAVAELRHVAQRLAAGEAHVVQFSDVTYTPSLLAEVDSLAVRFGDLLEVRFYGHRNGGFDCAMLEKIPAVTNLSVDCLLRVSNIEVLARLAHLRTLSLGVEELAATHVLGYPNLRRLRDLTVGETKTKALDLSPLEGFSELEALRICGQTRGIQALTAIRSLKRLWLNRIGRGTHLEFLSGLDNLQTLGLLLGGRSSIAEIDMPRLAELDICRVQGLGDLGDLSRFRGLVSLRIDEQARLERVAFSAANAELRRVYLLHCKSLRTLSGLEMLPRLEELRIWSPVLDRQELLGLKLPPSLAICALYTKKEREDALIVAELRARGYRES